MITYPNVRTAPRRAYCPGGQAGGWSILMRYNAAEFIWIKNVLIAQECAADTNRLTRSMSTEFPLDHAASGAVPQIAATCCQRRA